MKRIIGGAALFIILWGVFAFGIRTATQGNILGSDFFIFWNAGRAAIFERQNPYSDALSLQAQISVFKRPAAAGEDQLGFAYPPYALLAILPLLFLSFDWASAIWISLLTLLLVAAGAWALRGKQWVIPTFLLFYPTFFGVILGNFAVGLSAGLLLMFGMILRGQRWSRGMQISLGLLAGWMTIKPQFLWLFLFFIALYALREKLWWFLVCFSASVVGCVVVSFALVPNWLPFWLERLTKYTVYNQTLPVTEYLLGQVMPVQAANIASLILLIVLIGATMWMLWRWWRGKLAVIPLWAWLGLVVFLAHPHGASYEHLAFLLPLVVWAAGQADWRSLPLNLFWWGSLAVSWAAFFISKAAGAPASAAEWPILFHLVWVGWMLRGSSQADSLALLRRRGDVN
jgi:hypothetical protein